MISLTSFAALACLHQDPGPQATAPARPIAIDVSIGPAADLWFELRSRAASEAAPTEGDPFGPAIAAARRLEGMLASPLVWQRVDEYFLTCELPGGFAPTSREPLRIPAQLRGPAGRIKEIAEASLALGSALDALAPEWLEREWPTRKAELEKRREEVLGVLTPETQWVLMDELTSELRLPPPAEPFVVTLVTRIPPPGDETLRFGMQQGSSFVFVSGRGEDDLLEAVLREILHVSQGRAFWPPSVFTMVSKKLSAARIPGQVMGDVERSLYFLYAAELVRRHADPDHVDLGATSGDYERMGGVVDDVRPLFVDFLAQKLDESDFTAALVAAAAR